MGKTSSSPPRSAAPLWEATFRRQSVERHVGGNHTTHIIAADNIFLKGFEPKHVEYQKVILTEVRKVETSGNALEPTREGMKVLSAFRIVRHTFLATYRA